MRYYEVELEAMMPATKTVLVWATDEKQAYQKALDGKTLEEDDVEINEDLFEPEDVIGCQEVPEEEIDERTILWAEKEAKEQAQEEVVAD